MLKNYFKIAFRNLWRHKGYSFINVGGLAVGMAVCLLIGLYIEDELSFDRFHENTNQLFFVTGRSLSTPYSLATVLESMSEVEQTTRFWRGRTITITHEEEQNQVNQKVLLAEPSFFEMFTFPVVAGTPSTTLQAPDAAVITESMAHRFFGPEIPIGKSLEFQRSGPGNNVHSVTIGAVVKDSPPNSSIQFDLIVSLASLGPDALRENAWGFDLFETYVQTISPLPADAFSARITEALKRHIGSETELKFSALPLPALHLSGLTADGLKGQSRFLYIFGTIALFILLTAAINYVNLITAQATQRNREVGVRKVMGAGRYQLMRQFLGESTLLSIGALIISLCLTELALPEFSRLFDKELTFWGAEYSITLPLLAGVVLLLVLLASVYPAYVISQFQPTEALRCIITKAAPARKFGLRQSLVVLQFTISVGLIIGTAVIYYQLEYVQSKDLGFNDEQVVVVDLGAQMPASLRESLRERILSHHGVVSASVPNAVPDRFLMGYTRSVANTAPQSLVGVESVQFRPAVVDYDFIPTLQIPLLAGRNFSRDFSTDIFHAYVLNRAAAEQLGWSPEEAIGKTFKLGPAEIPEGEIIGVVDNFHIESLHQRIKPVVLQLHTLSPVESMPFKLAAKLAPEQIRNAVEHIRREFNQIAPPGTPFQYIFLSDRFDEMYRAEEQISRIITAFSALAIIIACLGLFGLAAYTAEHRTKEIGIRKVMGATVTNIVALLNKDFLKLVLIGFVIAAPIAWYAMNRWLEDFAYRIEIGWWVFVLAGGLTLVIALLTVSVQAVRTALTNPVESLRHE